MKRYLPLVAPKARAALMWSFGTQRTPDAVEIIIDGSIDRAMTVTLEASPMPTQMMIKGR